jgi:hypothetical protein
MTRSLLCRPVTIPAPEEEQSPFSKQVLWVTPEHVALCHYLIESWDISTVACLRAHTHILQARKPSKGNGHQPGGKCKSSTLSSSMTTWVGGPQRVEGHAGRVLGHQP